MQDATSRKRMLLRIRLDVRGLAGHLHTEAKVVFLEKLVVVGSCFWATSDTSKTPSVQLASEGSELGLLKEFRQDFSGKLLFLVDDEGLAVREPSDDIRVRFLSENVKELWFEEQNSCGG